MARRSTPPPPQPAKLSVDQMKQGIVILQRRIGDLEKLDPATALEDDVYALEKSIEASLERVFGRGTSDYDRYLTAAGLDDGPISLVDHGYQRDTRRYWTEGKQKSITHLKQAVKDLEERIGDASAHSEHRQPADAVPASADVFIVHGHDDGTRETVARFLSALGLRPVILHEQPNRGRTIIEKFEQSSNVGFAVVLLTPDDVGGVDAEHLKPRARQNVILELGYFVGRLRRDRVCAIVRGNNVELPSDIHGVVWTSYEGNWKFDLAKELKAAGYDIDMNKAF